MNITTGSLTVNPNLTDARPPPACGSTILGEDIDYRVFQNKAATNHFLKYFYLKAKVKMNHKQVQESITAFVASDK